MVSMQCLKTGKSIVKMRRKATKINEDQMIREWKKLWKINSRYLGKRGLLVTEEIWSLKILCLPGPK